MGGSFKAHGFNYEGKLEVIKNYLRYDYLWNNIRVKGGAYGCVVDLDYRGNIIFSSYRDPNIESSIDVYKEFPNHIRSKDFSKDEVVKLIIGTVSKLDIPLSDSAKLSIKTNNFITGIDFDFISRIRNQILNVKPWDIKKSAEIFEKVFSEGKVCVIGNENKIDGSKNLFDEFLKL